LDFEERKLAFDLETDLHKKTEIALFISDNARSQGDFALAEEYGLKALNLSELTSSTTQKIHAMGILGSNLCFQKKLDQAKKWFLQAIDVAETANDLSHLANCFNNMGNVHFYSGELDMALVYYHKALKSITDEQGDTFKANLYNNIGTVLCEMDKNTDAVYYLKNAIKILWKHGDSANLANSFVNLANVYHFKKEFSLALGYYKRAIVIYEKLNHVNLMANYQNMITLYISIRRFSEALNYAFKAMAYNKKLQDKRFQFAVLHAIFIIYLEMNEPTVCKEYIDLCKDLLQHIDNNHDLFLFHETCSKYYELINDYQSANQHLRLCLEYSEKVHKSHYIEKIAEEKAKIDYEFKHQEVETYKKRSTELEIYNQTIETQKEELIALNNSKDAILNIVSHDLKNSVGSILPIIELMRNHKLNQKNERYLKMIENSAVKSLDLVKDILDASKIEMKDYQLLLKPMDINLLIRTYQSQIQAHADLKQIKTQFNFCNRSLQCMVNETKFQQICINLISNALKFTPSNGLISIRTHAVSKDKKDFAEIIFKDSGIGIPQESLPYIFEKFSKASRTGVRGEKSTGLGMSIVKRLVELHQGQIEVESEPQKGTTIRVRIPLHHRHKTEFL
jgi:signal transduction histidine kinase